jgi:hypothetical protein
MNMYTKGEWKSREERDGLAAEVIENDKGVSIALILSLDDSMKPLPPDEVKANAHLIAAAPENYEMNSETLRLYRYLRDYEEALWNQLIDVCPGIIDHWDRIKKALAKAEGKE